MVQSSSTLAPQAGNSCAPLLAMDGDNRTAWGDGVGQWLKVSYDSPKVMNGLL